MIRYWFEFEQDDKSFPCVEVNFGCGVTGYDRNDAIKILQETIFREAMPSIKQVVENIDISTLDEGHVKPSIGDVYIRGVWFPLGYKAIR